jgi:hypothetical protein
VLLGGVTFLARTTGDDVPSFCTHSHLKVKSVVTTRVLHRKPATCTLRSAINPYAAANPDTCTPFLDITEPTSTLGHSIFLPEGTLSFCSSVAGRSYRHYLRLLHNKHTKPSWSKHRQYQQRSVHPEISTIPGQRESPRSARAHKVSHIPRTRSCNRARHVSCLHASLSPIVRVSSALHIPQTQALR